MDDTLALRALLPTVNCLGNRYLQDYPLPCKMTKVEKKQPNETIGCI